MSSDHRLTDLLLQWKAEFQQGRDPSPEEMKCPPELAEKLTQQIRDLKFLSGWDKPFVTPSPGLPKARLPNLPDYELKEYLGGGGFGQVYKAIRRKGGFQAALKFIDLASTGSQLELRALGVMQGIQHLHLLTVFLYWEQDGFLVIDMEWADGGTLLDRFRTTMAQGKPITQPGELLDLLKYFEEAAKAIDYLNKPEHLIDGRKTALRHRDIKPANLLLFGNSVKVGDYGLVRPTLHSVTGHSGLMSEAYAAPEFFGGFTHDHSDQFSLAATYCHVRGGRLPFTDDDIRQFRRGQFNCIADLTMLPEAERPLVARSLARNPEKRWPSCHAFVDSLQRALTASRPDSWDINKPQTQIHGSITSNNAGQLLDPSRLINCFDLGVHLCDLEQHRIGFDSFHTDDASKHFQESLESFRKPCRTLADTLCLKPRRLTVNNVNTSWDYYRTQLTREEEIDFFDMGGMFSDIVHYHKLVEIFCEDSELPDETTNQYFILPVFSVIEKLAEMLQQYGLPVLAELLPAFNEETKRFEAVYPEEYFHQRLVILVRRYLGPETLASPLGPARALGTLDLGYYIKELIHYNGSLNFFLLGDEAARMLPEMTPRIGEKIRGISARLDLISHKKLSPTTIEKLPMHYFTQLKAQPDIDFFQLGRDLATLKLFLAMWPAFAAGSHIAREKPELLPEIAKAAANAELVDSAGQPNFAFTQQRKLVLLERRIRDTSQDASWVLGKYNVVIVSGQFPCTRTTSEGHSIEGSIDTLKKAIEAELRTRTG